MELIAAVAVLVVVYFLITKIRGPLPKDQESRFGGAEYDDETKTNPNEE